MALEEIRPFRRKFSEPEEGAFRLFVPALAVVHYRQIVHGSECVWMLLAKDPPTGLQGLHVQLLGLVVLALSSQQPS